MNPQSSSSSSSSSSSLAALEARLNNILDVQMRDPIARKKANPADAEADARMRELSAQASKLVKEIYAERQRQSQPKAALKPEAPVDVARAREIAAERRRRAEQMRGIRQADADTVLRRAPVVDARLAKERVAEAARAAAERQANVEAAARKAELDRLRIARDAKDGGTDDVTQAKQREAGLEADRREAQIAAILDSNAEGAEAQEKIAQVLAAAEDAAEDDVNDAETAYDNAVKSRADERFEGPIEVADVGGPGTLAFEQFDAVPYAELLNDILQIDPTELIDPSERKQIEKLIAPYLSPIPNIAVDAPRDSEVVRALVTSLMGAYDPSEPQPFVTNGLFELIEEVAITFDEYGATRQMHRILDWLLVKILTGAETPARGDAARVQPSSIAENASDRRFPDFYDALVAAGAGAAANPQNNLTVGGRTIYELATQSAPAPDPAWTRSLLLIDAYERGRARTDLPDSRVAAFLGRMAPALFDESTGAATREYARLTAGGRMAELSRDNAKALRALFSKGLKTAPARADLSDMGVANEDLGYLVARALASPLNAFLAQPVRGTADAATVGELGRSYLVQQLLFRPVALVPGNGSIGFLSIFARVGIRPVIGADDAGRPVFLQSAAAAASGKSRALTFGSLFGGGRSKSSVWALLNDQTGDAKLYRRAARFVAALQRVDDLRSALADLESGKRYTVFVPDNDAWDAAAIRAGRPLPAEALNDLLRAHVLIGDVPPSAIPRVSDKAQTRTFTTFQDPGETFVTIERKDRTLLERARGAPERLVANGRTLVLLDQVAARNGQIYLVDEVIPAEPTAGLSLRRPLEQETATASKTGARPADASSVAKTIRVRVAPALSTTTTTTTPSTAVAREPAAKPSEPHNNIAAAFSERADKAGRRAGEAKSGAEALAAVAKLSAAFDERPADVRRAVPDAAWRASIDRVRAGLVVSGHAFDTDASRALDSLFDRYYMRT